MPGERDAENLRVALMSYDDRELRIRKFYLEEQSTIIRCTCFQSGEPVLQALRQERCFDVLVLSSQLEDMDSLTFLEKLNRLPSHPPLLLQGDGWADDITAAHLQPGSRFYGVGHDHLRDLLRGLLGVPGRNSMQIERFCTHLYELWKLPQPDTNCEYLTLAVQIACSADENWRSAKRFCRASRNNITSRWPLWTAACAVWLKGWRHGTRWNGSTSRRKTA